MKAAFGWFLAFIISLKFPGLFGFLLILLVAWWLCDEDEDLENHNNKK